MPTYEYRCSECGHQYERREGFDAPAVQRCPNCQGEARRLIHAPPILFKGSGFYVTDNRKSALVGSPAGSNGSNGNGDGEKDYTVEAAPAKDSKPAKTPEKSSEAAAAS